LVPVFPEKTHLIAYPFPDDMAAVKLLDFHSGGLFQAVGLKQ
jgi:hypothetical protein